MIRNTAKKNQVATLKMSAEDACKTRCLDDHQLTVACGGRSVNSANSNG